VLVTAASANTLTDADVQGFYAFDQDHGNRAGAAAGKPR
jgi:hypothetical protein